MAKGREIKLPLPAADDLFSTQEERDEAKREFIADIPLTEISDFPDHPYKVKQDESMLELASSIREKGVVNPALVRPKPEGGYEMVAGHRRKLASELAGKVVMPCIVRNLTDDEATIIMMDSNLQREKVLPSEKAFACLFFFQSGICYYVERERKVPGAAWNRYIWKYYKAR